MPKIAAYGTLKAGHYNHYLLSGDEAKQLTPLTTGTIKGTIGVEPGTNYPVASTTGGGVVFVEIHDVSPKIAREVGQMEALYGYHPEAVELCGHIAVMWCREPSNQANILKDGVF